jgi:hypothetical protein
MRALNQAIGDFGDVERSYYYMEIYLFFIILGGDPLVGMEKMSYVWCL